MIRTKTLCALVALGFLVVPGCGGGGGGGGGGGPTDPDPPPGDDPPADVAAEVTIEDNAFVAPDGGSNQDASVTIQVGETVRWTHSGSVQHTVTSGEGAGGNAGDGLPDGAGQGLDSGTLSSGDTFEFTFNTAGTWTYYCEVHPGIMFEATVVVEE